MDPQGELSRDSEAELSRDSGDSAAGLRRAIGLRHATAMVVGTIIGARSSFSHSK